MGAALPIVAAIIIGSTAVAGTIGGHVIANTSPGRRMFMGLATFGSAMTFGAMGLVAAPVLIGYNLLSGKRNAVSTALGTTFQTIGRLSKRVGAAVGGLSYSDKEVVEANDVKERREKTQKKISQSQKELADSKADKKKMRQNRVRRFFTRPFAKSGKKEAEIGIVHESVIKGGKAIPAPSEPTHMSPPPGPRLKEADELSVYEDAVDLSGAREEGVTEAIIAPTTPEPAQLGFIKQAWKTLKTFAGYEETQPVPEAEEAPRRQELRTQSMASTEDYPESHLPTYSEIEAKEIARRDDLTPMARWGLGGAYHADEVSREADEVSVASSEASFKTSPQKDYQKVDHAEMDDGEVSVASSYKSSRSREDDEVSVVSSSSSDSFKSTVSEIEEKKAKPKSFAEKEQERSSDKMSVQEIINAGKQDTATKKKQALTPEAIAERDAAAAKKAKTK